MKLVLAALLVAAPLVAGVAGADPVPDVWECTPESASTCALLNDPVDTAVGVVENPPEPDGCHVGNQYWC